MAKRCSKKYGCQKPRANWWRKSLGVDWLHSAGLSSTQGVSPEQVLAEEIYANHFTRVNADGGVIPSEADTTAYILDLIQIYGFTTEAEFFNKIPVALNPAIFGYKLGTGSGITLGQAAEKLYSVNEDGDVEQGTAASQPLLLRHNGDNYYFASRLDTTSVVRTTTSLITAYNTATDTMVVTARIFLNNQTAATDDFIVTIGSAGQFRLRNGGTSKSISFRGSATGAASSSYTPSATVPHWVRYTVTTTNVIYEWSASTANNAAAVDSGSWVAIGTIARPALGTLSGTFSVGGTAGSTTNATSIYYILIENQTAGTSCHFTPNMFSRVVNQNLWDDVDCRWQIVKVVAATGIKNTLVDETVVIGDGVAMKLSNALAINQPYTAYVALRRMGTGPIYGLAASSQLSNNATNTTLDNGTALNIADVSTDKELITVVANGASSSLQIDNGLETTGDGGSNDGTYLDVLANDSTYGNYVLTSLIIANGA